MNKEDCRKSSLYVACGCMPAKVAEGEGFKPPIPERGIPDFESSAIDHSANLPFFATAKLAIYFQIQIKMLVFFVCNHLIVKELLLSAKNQMNIKNLPQCRETGIADTFFK